MADIFQEVEEDVRRERYARLWRKYGLYLLAAAGAIVLVIAGGVAWRQYQFAAREADGQRFAEALFLSQQGQHKEAAAAFSTLGEGSRGSYGALAHLSAAADLVAAGDTAGAVALYDAIAADGDVDSVLRDLARLFAALHLVDGGDAAALQTRLEPLLEEDNVWRYSAREVEALAAVKAGAVERARAAFAALAA
ncbi:MAG: tetratricopeptide repeat protein, partial [Alphaproteobacteria bacterium]|nr:tetratricopeptide repeat protein [Alphaproteobacteria bacterium]